MNARVARAEQCDDVACSVSHLLVRGDRIEFVSAEQERKVGRHPLSEKKMPSDVRLPKGYVLVHDTSGTLFDPCHMYVVRWRKGAKKASDIRQNDVKTAYKYFGNGANLTVGEVEVPHGPWRKIAKISFIRYRRQGYAGANYEHPFEPKVFLYSTRNPLAWKLKLPNGCIVDERGFVRP